MSYQLTEFERGYLSGFLDADGYISLIVQKRKNRKEPAFRPTIGFTNSKREVIEWIYNRFGRRGMRYQSWRNKWGSKIVYSVAFAETLTAGILPQLELKVKSAQQRLLLEAIALKRWSREFEFWRWNKPMWKRIYARLGQIKEEIQRLNRRN